MKQEYKYLLYLGGALLVLILVEYFAPKPIDWSFTLARKDKIPYGTYVLDEVIEDLFPGRRVIRSHQTLFELQQDSPKDANMLILAYSFAPDSLDTDALLQFIHGGGHALVAANFYGHVLADTLHLKVKFYELKQSKDSVRTDQTYFAAYDTASTVVLAHQRDQPVLLQTRIGRGSLLLSSLPQDYTNYHLLKDNNDREVAQTLSLLPVQDVYWTEYYQAGRMESPSPLRYVLSQRSLRWALYLTLLTTLLFMIFEAKRKQRAIPVVEPPANTTLEFVSTVSHLFLRTRDHKHMAEKKIQYFLEDLRTRYRLDTTHFDASFKDKLAHKSGKSKEEVEELVSAITRARQQTKLSDQELLTLNQRIDTFYENKFNSII